jgi:hypothetical protein
MNIGMKTSYPYRNYHIEQSVLISSSRKLTSCNNWHKFYFKKSFLDCALIVILFNLDQSNEFDDDAHIPCESCNMAVPWLLYEDHIVRVLITYLYTISV